jgi:hypothetical protein
VKIPHPALKKSLATLAVLVHIVFLIEAICPLMVWCHKSGGRTALEFQAGESECRCEQCDLCRARRPGEPGTQNDRRPVWNDIHCSHESIYSEASRSSFLTPKKRPAGFDASSAPPSVGPPACPDVAANGLLPFRTIGFPTMVPDLSGVLRC